MSRLAHTDLGSGLSISKIVTGLWQIADMERGGESLDPASRAPAMQQYVDAGFTTFDMADHYGSAEIIAGHFREGSPDASSIKLLTKWVPEPGKVSMATVKQAVERSMARLQTDQLDLLQYHAWSYPDPAWLDTLFMLQELKQQGLIKHLGVTNFDAAHLRIALASGIDLVTNQVSYSLLDQRANGEMKQVCQQYGVKLLAFGTLAGGFLSDRWLNQQEPEINDNNTWSQMKYKRFIDVTGGWDRYQQVLAALKPIAEKHQASIANVAVNYILSQPHVAAVIVGARLAESEHISDNIKVIDIQLDKEDNLKIAQVLSALQPVPGDCGDEYRKPPFLTASGDLSHHVQGFPKPYNVTAGPNGKQQVVSGTYWEEMAGYCRAVRTGNIIKVSGTTATHGDKQIGGSDLKAQTHFIIDKIEGAIISLGGTLEDVDRTRIFVSNIDNWEPVARAHGERFSHIQPANTLVEARLVGDDYLVEIEAEATLN